MHSGPSTCDQSGYTTLQEEDRFWGSHNRRFNWIWVQFAIFIWLEPIVWHAYVLVSGKSLAFLAFLAFVGILDALNPDTSAVSDLVILVKRQTNTRCFWPSFMRPKDVQWLALLAHLMKLRQLQISSRSGQNATTSQFKLAMVQEPASFCLHCGSWCCHESELSKGQIGSCLLWQPYWSWFRHQADSYRLTIYCKELQELSKPCLLPSLGLLRQLERHSYQHQTCKLESPKCMLKGHFKVLWMFWLQYLHERIYVSLYSAVNSALLLFTTILAGDTAILILALKGWSFCLEIFATLCIFIIWYANTIAAEVADCIRRLECCLCYWYCYLCDWISC